MQLARKLVFEQVGERHDRPMQAAPPLLPLSRAVAPAQQQPGRNAEHREHYCACLRPRFHHPAVVLRAETLWHPILTGGRAWPGPVACLCGFREGHTAFELAHLRLKRALPAFNLGVRPFGHRDDAANRDPGFVFQVYLERLRE